jgi:RNA polymerase sigma factor (TIGR02999 family)
MRGELTILLHRFQEGDKEAESQLMAAVYGELRRRARAYLRGERKGHTLEPTALVNEVYLKLAGVKRIDWKSRAHFFAIAAQMMRQILVDHARARLADKRGGGVELLPLEETAILAPGHATDVIVLHEALQRLQKKDARVHRIVELRSFGGLSVEETALVVGLSPRTVKKEFSVGRAWLRAELEAASKTQEAKP